MTLAQRTLFNSSELAVDELGVGQLTVDDLTLEGAAAHAVLVTGPAKVVQSLSLGPRQFPLGRTGTVPEAGQLAGTENQVTVTYDGGTLQLGTPQDLHEGATVKFENLMLGNELYSVGKVLAEGGLASGAVTPNRLLHADSKGNVQSVTIANAHGCNVSFNGGTLTCTLTQDFTFNGWPTLRGLTLYNGSLDIRQADCGVTWWGNPAPGGMGIMTPTGPDVELRYNSTYGLHVYEPNSSTAPVRFRFAWGEGANLTLADCGLRLTKASGQITVTHGGATDQVWTFPNRGLGTMTVAALEGSQTFSGTVTFSGTTTFSSAATFNGTTTFGGAVKLTGFAPGVLLSTDATGTIVAGSAGFISTGNLVVLGPRAGTGSLSTASAASVVIGPDAGKNITNTAWLQHTMVGMNAGLGLTTALNCTALGYAACMNQNGADNTAVGVNAMRKNATPLGIGAQNVAIGHHAMYSGTNAVGSYNVGVGAEALKALTGTGNTAVGRHAGVSVTSGSYNTIVGFHAGMAILTGTENVCIGAGSEVTDVGGKNRIAIGANVLNQTDNSAVIGDWRVSHLNIGAPAVATLGTASTPVGGIYLATHGGTSKLLSHYEETTINGIWGMQDGTTNVAVSFVIQVTRIGRLVNLTFPDSNTFNVVSGAPIPTMDSGSLPQRFRPIATYGTACYGRSAGKSCALRYRVNSEGGMQMQVLDTTTGFTGTGCNYGAFTITYPVPLHDM